jgi:recombination protein RecT
MSDLVKANSQNNVKSLLANVGYKKRFEEILGKKAAGFMSSLINLTNSDVNLSKADANSVIASAVVAATLDLPVDKNLGFAWILPYGTRAQFQLGYKGYIQLALRTGQYKNINVIEIYKGQLIDFNPLTEELKLDFSKKESNEVIGYAAYIKLVNGFEKTAYKPKEDVTAHAKRFSKTFNNGPWKTDFDAMAKKTVLKNTLSKWGILSIEMQTAIQADQAVIKNEVAEGAEVSAETIEYADGIKDADYTPVTTEPVKTKLDDKFKKAEESEKQSENIYEGTPFDEGEN